jgi:hypothetical protein
VRAPRRRSPRGGYSRADLDQLRAASGEIPVVSTPVKVQVKGRGFSWYSPALKPPLERVATDLGIEPRDREQDGGCKNHIWTRSGRTQ